MFASFLSIFYSNSSFFLLFFHLLSSSLPYPLHPPLSSPLFSSSSSYTSSTSPLFSLQKLKEARALINASGRDIRLQVDGGVTAANIKEIAEVQYNALQCGII